MRHAVLEHDSEPQPGLPEVLPAGEDVLWRGSPGWWGIATSVLHIRAVAVYFALLMIWSFAAALEDGRGLVASLRLAFGYLPIVTVTALAALVVIAQVISRTTVYTITSRRVVLRIGMALPMAINLPFARIESAAVKVRSDGSGDIALATLPGDSVSALFLWPHVRPLRLLRPQPMLRSVADAAGVGTILAQALAASVASHATDTDKVAPLATARPAARRTYRPRRDQEVAGTTQPAATA